ncbi:DUF3592 domain-containing protein [Streptomyces sp. NPDC056716]|uniref:DUF3592 domain-containing protein n=1 Tax=unclassified Streptomyces TaxID=2593676 RepID=UPI0036A768E4
MAFAFGLFGLIFSGIGLVIFRQDLLMRRNAVSVTGIVADRVFKPGGGSWPVSVIVKYTAQDGVTRESSVAAPTGNPVVQVGDTMEIVYNPANLRDVRSAEKFDSKKRMPGNGLVWLGGVFLAVAVIWLAAGI